jgi:hypothetical protein
MPFRANTESIPRPCRSPAMLCLVNSHMPCRSPAMPCRVNSHMPCRSPAMPCLVNSHMPCRAPAILRHYRVHRKSPRGSRKYLNYLSYSLTDWYVSDNKLRGTPRGSRKKPNAGRSPTFCLKTADANSHMPCHAHVAPLPRCAVALRICFQNGMVRV